MNTRMTTLAGIFLALILTMAGWGSTVAQDGEQLVAGEFVGSVTTPGAADEGIIAVAVVADAPEEGTTTRRIRAYVCDGQTYAEWYVNEQVTGNSFDLTAVSGFTELGPDGNPLPSGGKTRITGELTETAVSGTVTLADGQVLDYTAPLTDGRAGLYTLQLYPQGTIGGYSGSGTALEGTVDADLLESTLTLPDGTTVAFTDPRGGEVGPGTWTVIVSPVDDEDGLEAVGAKQAQTGSPSSGYTMRWIPF